MAIIDPHGLFYGERLARCSDLAQLLWPRFLLAANGYGRIVLDYDEFIRRPLASLRTPPTLQSISEIFREYRDNCLAFIYLADGQMWAQFECPDRCLPRHKTAADNRTPAPDAIELAAWRDAYIDSKAIASASEFKKLLGKVQKPSEPLRTFPLGVGGGVGGGVGDGKGKAKANTSPAPQDSLRVYEAYPRKLGRTKAIAAIELACKRLMAGEGPPLTTRGDVLIFLEQRCRAFARAPAGQRGNFTPYPASWFNGSRYLDDEQEWYRNGDEQSQRKSAADERLERIQRTNREAADLLGLDVHGNHDEAGDVSTRKGLLGEGFE